MVYVKEFLQAFEVLFWQIIGKKKHTNHFRTEPSLEGI